MHPLLARQIRKSLADLDVSQGPWADFIAAVDAAYVQGDQEREFVERTLDVVSDELTRANEQLRREAESRLRELTAYYERTLELQQGMIVCFRQEEGRFVHTLCRGALAVRLGWTAAAVEGHSLEHFLPPRRALDLAAVYARAWAGEAVTWEGCSEDGQLWYLAQLQPRYLDAVVTEVILSAVEISELKRSQDALRTAKEKAESADRAKSDFLAVMSHEIRTPMNAVIGFTSLLADTTLDATQERYVRMIESSGEGLLEVINDVLDISKIEAGRLDLSIEPVAPYLLASDVLDMMRSRAAEKGLELSVAKLNDMPEFVRCDRARLRQILVNLVGNAVKFTPAGSVRVELAYGPEHRLIGRVIDTGIGIEPEAMDRLFKPFSQVDSSTTRNFGGTGLGLAICKRLCEAMGGDIGVESTPNQGACFEFHLNVPPALDPLENLHERLFRAEPLAEAAAPAASAEAPLSPAPDLSVAAAVEVPAPDDPLILVADDNPTNQRVLGLMLEIGGFKRVLFAATGTEACAIVAEQPVEVIFMDVEMPDMDGIEATRRIRALPTSTAQDPWIVGLSANVFQETRRRALSSGMNVFLPKPVRRDTVLGAVRDRGQVSS